jgi:hypothetical protein
MDTIAPKLKELQTRECTLAELQAAMVQLIEMHNGLVADMNGMVNSGRIRSRKEAIMDTPYGL